MGTAMATTVVECGVVLGWRDRFLLLNEPIAGEPLGVDWSELDALLMALVCVLLVGKAPMRSRTLIVASAPVAAVVTLVRRELAELSELCD